MKNFGRLLLIWSLAQGACWAMRGGDATLESSSKPVSALSSAFGSQDDLQNWGERMPTFKPLYIGGQTVKGLSQTVEVVIKQYDPRTGLDPTHIFFEEAGTAADIRIQICRQFPSGVFTFSPWNNYDNESILPDRTLPMNSPFLIRTTWEKNKIPREHLALFTLLSENAVDALTQSLKQAPDAKMHDVLTLALSLWKRTIDEQLDPFSPLLTFVFNK